MEKYWELLGDIVRKKGKATNPTQEQTKADSNGTDNPFMLCSYNEMREMCDKKYLTIHYRGGRFKSMILDTEYTYSYEAYYNFHRKVFENSKIFSERVFEEDKIDWEYKHGYAFASENGIIHIGVSDYDALAYNNFTDDENDWETIIQVSSMDRIFIKDIMHAHEEYCGGTVYAQMYCEKFSDNFKILVLSDREIDSEEWQKYKKFDF